MRQVSELFQSECVPVGRSGYYAPAEATASVQLSHPQLVRSYKYAVLTRPAPTTPTGAVSTDDNLSVISSLSLCLSQQSERTPKVSSGVASVSFRRAHHVCVHFSMLSSWLVVNHLNSVPRTWPLLFPCVPV